MALKFYAMNRILLLAVLLLSFFSCTDSSEENKSKTTIEKTPHDFMFMQRAYPTGELKTDA